jgi:hypothetical protein
MPGKEFFSSTTVAGLIVLVLQVLLPKLGIEIVDPQSLTGSLIEAVGLLVAIVGTLRRSQPIATIAGLPNPLQPKP